VTKTKWVADLTRCVFDCDRVFVVLLLRYGISQQDVVWVSVDDGDNTVFCNVLDVSKTKLLFYVKNRLERT